MKIQKNYAILYVLYCINSKKAFIEDGLHWKNCLKGGTICINLRVGRAKSNFRTKEAFNDPQVLL